LTSSSPVVFSSTRGACQFPALTDRIASFQGQSKPVVRPQASMAPGGHEESLVRKVLTAYTYVAIWIGLSGAVIMYNKYLLAYAGFPYPITLTMW
jgi:hypothetical protein